jgi:hypothetical protein
MIACDFIVQVGKRDGKVMVTLEFLSALGFCLSLVFISIYFPSSRGLTNMIPQSVSPILYLSHSNSSKTMCIQFIVLGAAKAGSGGQGSRPGVSRVNVKIYTDS